MKQYAADLAKEYDFSEEIEYFDYIVSSLVNGNRSQVKSLFNQMHGDDQERFLINHLDLSVGIQKSVLNICISELIENK